MNSYSISSMVLAAALLVSAIPAYGQSKCGVSQTMAGVNVVASFSKSGFRDFSASLIACTGMAYGRVDTCTPNATMSGDLFRARNTNGSDGTANDFCQFTCAGPAAGGCTFNVNLADGLPVELLGFDVD